MVFEEIDLSDRRGFIDLVYGQQKFGTFTTPSAPAVQTLTPVAEVRKRARKVAPSYVVCSLVTGVILFVLALAAIFLTTLASHWLSSEDYEAQTVTESTFMPQPRKNVSHDVREEELYEEKEQAVDELTAEQLRLPNNLEPIWYNISLKVYLPGFVTILEEKILTTYGNIMIKINVKISTSHIVLNARKLTFPSDVSKVKILIEDENTDQPATTSENAMEVSVQTTHLSVAPQVQDILYNATLETVTFVLDKPLKVSQQVILQFPFHGRIGDSLHGLHSSCYVRRDGRNITLGVTDLQPLSPRGIFPCFDDPVYKCPLSLTVLHPMGTIARANAIELLDSQATPSKTVSSSFRSDPLWLKTTFDVTQPLGTHLMGFAVTDFDEREAKTKSAITVRIYSRPEAIKLTKFALETAIKVYDLLTKFFRYSSGEPETRLGASLLRMISAIVGRDAFQKATQHYVKTHAGREANYKDFWISLNNVLPKDLKSWNGENLDVADFANKWVLQMGYPVIDIYRLNAHTIELTQRRFKLNTVTPEKEKFRNALYWYKWEIPIFYEINGEKQEMVWLHEAVHLRVNLSDSFLINPDSFGFYRVNYDQQEWIVIADRMRSDHTQYSSTARARLLSDAFALAEAGELSYETLFTMISYLSRDTDYLPWSCALNGLKRIYELVLRTELEDSAKIACISWMKADFMRVRPTKKSWSSTANFRLSLAQKKLLVQFKTNLLDNCERSELASDCSRVPPSIRSLVYCAGVAQIEPEGFEQLLAFYSREVNEVERKRLVAALSCSKDPGQLRSKIGGQKERTNFFKRQYAVTIRTTALQNMNKPSYEPSTHPPYFLYLSPINYISNLTSFRARNASGSKPKPKLPSMALTVGAQFFFKYHE
ncbi:hypothetical protein KIN20_025657 [Parelaphostrongylus tenuis]|uniref:Aminopeptidase n=1 Tax=Parelaphostrongylus tenuis TaxID=148309 RepID=A0AAD5NC12_PARTN|nr:hypothetical protein KIN20_025657 [Parelaphostrongylus tenuis]